MASFDVVPEAFVRVLANERKKIRKGDTLHD